MFRSFSKRRRPGSLSRRTGATGRQIRSRRLAVESLEPRQMLSANPIDFGGLPALDFHGHNHELVPPGLAVAEARVETHWINGEQITVVADPALAGSLDAGAAMTVTSTALYPLTSIPQLHSNAGATVKLYLDFDGLFEPTSHETPVYDRDGDPTTFSDNELSLIYMAWAKVAEDFAPFNIDVTTVEPPELAPGVPESVANGVALRVAIGGDGAWTGSVLGGIASISAFTNSAENVVYVFSKNTGDGLADGDVASHEAGHGFGLGHQSLYDAQGNLINTYHPGDRNWAPIMGNTYVPVTTWYNGTSGSPTTFQDDMAVLAGSVNNFGYRADDHGSSIGTASPLSFDGQVFTGSGIIEINSDIDAWSFTISTEDTYQLTVNPAAIGPNLDAVLELRDAAGSLIAAASPAASQAAELLLPLLPGSYFLSVTKTAAYGWLGAYTMSVFAPPAGITVSASQPLVTREGRAATSFTVMLETQPTADVLIPLSSSDVGEGTISASSLLFTPTNWNVPQTVSVTGVNDSLQDGDAPYSIVFGPATSADPEYAGLDVADVVAVNLDNSSAGWLYWVDSGNDVIQRSTLHGTNVQSIVDLKALFGGVDGTYTPRYVAFDLEGGKLYWTDSSAGQIQRANLNGSNVETLVSGFTDGGLRGIAIDSAAGKMYWTDYAAQKIQRANLDGSGVQDVVTGALSGVRELALDLTAGKMYWGDYNENNIRRSNLNGTNVEVVWSGVDADNPSGIALDTISGKMYWSDAGRDKILRANLDGSDVEELIDLSSIFASSTVASLAIDAAAGKLYFSDFANKVVFRANLDGSDLVAIVSNGLSAVQGIAILRPGATVTPHAALLTSESGAATAFQVTLTTPPSANVTIPISSSDVTEGAVLTSSLTFTPTNWNVPQTVTVTGVNDATFDGSVAYSVILGAATSTDPDYAGLNPRDVSLTNLDNEVKFYVVNDATANTTYKYGENGSSQGSTTLTTANAAPRGVASTILGDKTWVIDANRNVYVYRTSDGALLGSWTAGTLANNATPEGIATNGTDVWIVDSKSDKVFRYAGAASRLSGTQTAASSFNLGNGNTNPKDIVTDGASLWVVDDTAKTDKVFKYSVAGTLAGSWTIDAANKAPTGITIDPANVSHIWIVDSGTDRVYQYNSAATRTSGSQAAAVTFALASGNTNPQGIADPPALGTVVVAAPTTVVTTRYDGTNMPCDDGFGVNARQGAILHSRVTGIRPGSIRPQSIRSDLILARELVFDAFDQERHNMRVNRTLRSALDSEHNKADCAEHTEEYNSTFDEAVDAVFANAI